MKLIINGSEVELNKDDLAKGIEAGQFELKTDNLKVFGASDFEAYQKNLADAEYKKGKQSGEEMLIKAGREKYGLEFEGKTLDNFAEAFKTKTLKEASIEPNKKVQELTADMEKLRLINSEWETKYNSLTGQVESERKQLKIENMLMAALPKDALSIPIEDVVSLIKSKSEFDLSENGIVIKKNGEILKNNTNLNPLTLQEYLPDVIKPYMKPVQGGAGGGHSTQAKAGTVQAFTEEMAAKGVNPNSAEFQTEMQKRIKEGTLVFK